MSADLLYSKSLFSRERDMLTPLGSKSPQRFVKGFQFQRVNPFISSNKFNENISPSYSNMNLNLNMKNEPTQNIYPYANQESLGNTIQVSAFILIRNIKEKNLKGILEFLSDFDVVSYNYERNLGLIVKFSSEESAYKYIVAGPKSLNDPYSNEAVILNCQFYYFKNELNNPNYDSLNKLTHSDIFYNSAKRPLQSLFPHLSERYKPKSFFEKLFDVFFNR